MTRTWIWLAWLPIAIALALRPFLAEIGAKGVHPIGRIGALLAIAAAIPVWLKIREKLPRIELPLLAIAVSVPPLVREPRATLVTILIVLAACGFGRCACDWVKLCFETRSAEIAVSAGIGFSAWIVVLIALGLAGQITSLAIAVTLGIAVAAFRRGVLRICSVLGTVFRDWHATGAFAGVQTMFLGAMILVLQPVVLTPSLLYDALATHLAASRNFSLHHTIAPFGDYGFLPQGFELMMGAADSLAGQAAAQMVAPVFLGLTWLAIFAIARELGAARRIALASAIFATTLPFVQWTGAIAKNDIPMAFFLLAALLVYLQSSARGDPRWVLAGAFLAAAAENVKHTGLLGVLPLAILFVIAILRQPHGARMIPAAAAVFLVTGSFWMLRAGLSHGNPLYPLYAPGGDAPSTAGLPSVLDRVAYVVSLQFRGMPIYEGTSDTRLGPFFLLFFPAILWFRRGDWSRRTLACCFFVAIYLAIWISSWPALRYATAPVLLLAIAVAAGLARAIEAAPGWIATALLSSIVLCHLFNLSTLAGMSLNLPRLQYLVGRFDRESYLKQSLGSYGALAWVRDHGPADARILAIGTHALAYAPDPAFMTPLFTEDGPFPLGDVQREIASGNYRYAIISKSSNVHAIFERRAPDFEDSHFAVYKLP
jgi:Dolichyl-phosphate-mannose-protein mannosyltransferase